MKRIGIDTETYLINAEQGIVAPRMVCLTYCTEDAEVGLLGREDALAFMHALLDADDIVFVAHHARFDMSVLAAADATLLPKIFRAYDEGRVRCTMVREKLLALSRGELADEGETGAKRNVKFSLAACVQRRFGIDLSEAKVAKGGPLPWRLRFSQLDGIPVEQWPAEARDYALDDAKWNLALFDAQTAELNAEGMSGETIPDEVQQTRGAFWLYLLSVRGVRTDPQRVNVLDAELKKEYARINALVRAADVLKPKMQKGEMVWTKNMTALRDRVIRAYGGEDYAPKTEKGAISTAREDLLKPADPTVLKWIEKKEQEADEARASASLPERDAADTAALLKDLCYRAAEHFGHDPEQVYNWLVLQAVGERSGVEKLLGTYVPVLLQGTQYPITPTFNELVASGRTSSVNPNLQNPPRKGGVRECFVPRPGFYYAFCDYSFIELCTLAQTCLEWFGWSAMADAINAGLDPHLDMAASMLGITYEEAVARKKQGDPQIAEYRQLSKCFHPDTEVLTRSGWKRIADLASGEEVAAAEPSYGGGVTLTWQVPSQVFSKPGPGSLIHLQNEGMDLRVTDDHRMLAFQNASGKVGAPKVVSPEKMGRVRYWANAGTLAAGHLDIDENMLRLAVATQADGNYPTNGRQIRFGFKKQRKIDRLLSLLAPHGAGAYAVSKTTQGVTQIVIRAELADRIRRMLDQKMLPLNWLDLSPASREVVLDEVPHWDGHVRENWTMWKYTSTIRQNVEVVQALATLSGRKTRVVVKAAVGNHAEQYEISVKNHHLTRGGNLSVTRIPYEGDVVCLSVASSYVVVRDGGVPVVTGQCLNFGYPGGLGAAKFVEYARAGYGVIITETEARKRKEDWYKKWPEMRKYHERFGNLTLGDRKFALIQPGSNRIRGEVGFCDGANCVDYQTEALTQRGWVKGHDLRIDDFILTKNAETGQLEWQQPTHIFHYPDYDGPLVEFKSTRFSAVTTPEHRWLVNKKRGGSTCLQTHEISHHGDDRIHRTGEYVGEEAPHEDAFLELVGWFLTDGSMDTDGGSTRIRIYQTKEATSARIDDMFARLGIPVQRAEPRSRTRGQRVGKTWSFSDLSVHRTGLTKATTSSSTGVGKTRGYTKEDYVFAGMGVEPDTLVAERLKVTSAAVGAMRRRHDIPRPVRAHHGLASMLRALFPERTLTAAFVATLSGRQARLLLETLLLGDGTVSKNGQEHFYTRSESAADAFQMLLVLAGQASKSAWTDLSQRVIPKYDSMPNSPKPTGIWTVDVYKRDTVQVLKHHVREFTEARGVWCPSVPNTYFVARREKTVYITGNSVFQGRAADGAKRAGWYIAKECYLRDPYRDGSGPTPLFGSRPVLFVHDEFILEVPVATAHEATLRLSAVMTAGMKEVVPDVKVGTEYAIAARWYKGASAVYDANGRLIPWEPKKK